MALPRNQQGQISIFFSASLVVMISIIAFVINIGLFVKAKINLQNATDSAAFAGAATQSRQLAKIAYLNWEMRNIYKEWMYKYYVIGNLNIKDVENPEGSGVMQFRLRDDVNVLESDPTKSTTADPFNIPAVCIHIAGSETNICKRYSIPGLPEFGSSNLPGAEEASRAFMDVLISTKVNDCIDRTRLNMSVANTWAYNVLASSMDESIAGVGPAILSDRQGAWPRAVELAMRIRNLEFVMNRPAETSGICSSGSTELTRCGKSISDIEGEKRLGNERIIKAFYSAYRNLGNETDNEMKSSFTLTEIPPKAVFNENDANASNLLLSGNADGRDPRQKQWVDLKLMMVNYATFYAAMIPRADSATSGACDISKVAIPVPGYPMGFYKNPDVLTYYAVKGEAEFLGMFNPFRDGLIKLEAYSAAKPFGGRIGPVLFIQKPGENYLVSRNTSSKYRSVPYITSYDFTGVSIRGVTHTKDNFLPGIPLPTNSSVAPGSFWLETPESPLGGKIADSNAIQFGVPNLVYDYQVPFKTTGYTDDNLKINTIQASNPGGDKEVGLFSKHQFRNFKGTALTATVSPQVLDEEVARVRAATSYEAANYLIPTPHDFNDNNKNGNNLDSFGFISGSKKELNNGYDRYSAHIYAPLYRGGNEQVDLLYGNSEQVVTTIHDFMRAQESGMNKYKKAMNRAAMSIYDQINKLNLGASGSADGYIRAAKGVSDIDFTDPTNYDQNPATCQSLAGQFLYFYYGEVGSEVPESPVGCPRPLGSLIREYFTQTDNNFSPSHYNFEFSWKRGTAIDEGSKFMSSYTPGPFTGVGNDGFYTSPIDSAINDNMRRNNYSTKFISLDSLRTGSEAQWDNPGFAIYSEGDIQSSANRSTETAQQNFVNILQPDVVNADLSTIKY